MNHLVINVAISLQLGIISNVPALSAHPDTQLIPHEPGIIVPIFRQIDKLPVSHIETLQPIEPIQVAPVAAPAPNTASSTANVGQAVANCGDNSYANFIYMHESGCNTAARNSIGCLGIGQACPGSKLYAACPSLDYSCENGFFTAYANAAYGGWANACQFWQSHHWW